MGTVMEKTLLPDWLVEPMANGVVTREEAQMVHTMQDRGPMKVTPELDDALQRLFQWELDSPSMLLH